MTPYPLLFEVTLAKWEYEVIAVCDGDQAWEAYQREKPTIAILDWMMPGIDGAEKCAAGSAPSTPPCRLT
jgi:DNA-binding response OmpR family regulator